MPLENIIGNFKSAYQQTEIGTMLHVDELMKARQKNPALQDIGFYTADGMIYFMDGDTPKLAITREADNLVLRHIDDAFTQLVYNQNYYPLLDEAQQSIHAKNTVIIDLTQLFLSKHDDEYSYLEIFPNHLVCISPLKNEQRTFFERMYGSGQEFIATMNMLAETNILKSRIYFLNPDYIKKKAVDSPIGRASCLYNFGGNSRFDADVREVSNKRHLRAVHRESVSNPVHSSGSKEESKVPSDSLGTILPSVDDVLGFSKSFIPDRIFPDYEAGLRTLYK